MSAQTTLLTSKKRRSHQTWKTDSPMTTPITKRFHHLTRLLVLSAVLRWVRSRTTMYDCFVLDLGEELRQAVDSPGPGDLGARPTRRRRRCRAR